MILEQIENQHCDGQVVYLCNLKRRHCSEESICGRLGQIDNIGTTTPIAKNVGVKTFL